MPLNTPELIRLFTFPENRLPSERLIDLVKGLQQLFIVLMERNWADENDLSMIPPDYQPNLNQSLQELTPHYEELINRIGNLSNAVLMTHGLIGTHLNFNLKVINASFTHFVHNPKKKSLKTLLETIDELLENLIGATGTGGPIDEIIDSLKVALTLEN